MFLLLSILAILVRSRLILSHFRLFLGHHVFIYLSFSSISNCSRASWIREFNLFKYGLQSSFPDSELFSEVVSNIWKVLKITEAPNYAVQFKLKPKWSFHNFMSGIARGRRYTLRIYWILHDFYSIPITCICANILLLSSISKMFEFCKFEPIVKSFLSD